MKSLKSNKLYLHIGPHKTGSSYLQKLLTHHRQKLFEFGISYPDILFSLNGHHKIAHYFRKNTPKEDIFNDLIRLRESSEDILLSSEVFSQLDLKDINALKYFFNGWQIEIICYVRNPSKRIVSFWQETIKQGSKENFWAYSLPHFVKPLSSPILNQGIVIDLYSRVFGKSHVHLIDYDYVYKNGQMLESLLRIIGASGAISDEDIKVNTMLNSEDLELLRVLNIISDGMISPKDNRKIFSRIKNRRIYDTLTKNIRNNMKKIVLGNTQADRAILSRISKLYGDMFVSELDDLQEKSYYISTDLYLCNQTLIKKLKGLQNEIFENLKAGM